MSGVMGARASRDMRRGKEGGRRRGARCGIGVRGAFIVRGRLMGGRSDVLMGGEEGRGECMRWMPMLV